MLALVLKSPLRECWRLVLALALVAIILMLVLTKADRIDAAAAPAYSCRGACGSDSAVDRKVKPWGPGERVEQTRLDGKNLPKKNAFQKTERFLGTFPGPNSGTRLVPRLVRFASMKGSIVQRDLTPSFRRPRHAFSMPLLAVCVAKHFHASLQASCMLSAINRKS